jgi:putative CocE/NonD family hydrolase
VKVLLRLIIRITVSALIISSLIAGFSALGYAQTKQSRPGVYSGYSKQLYDGWKRFSQYVAVRDGTKLAVDIYRPTLKGEVVNTPHPVVWLFTPYRRAVYTRDGKIMPGTGGANMLEMTKYGYVVAIVDTRGKGASFGTRQAPHNRTEAEDSYDIMEWLGTQSWSTGRIGMWGGSYLGGTVENAVTTMSPYLKAVFFGITDFNMYDGWVRGGIFRYTAGADTPYTDDLQSVPVEEDADKSMLKAAVEEHKHNTLLNSLMEETPYRDSWSNLSDSYWWDEVSFSNYIDQIKRSGVAAYVYGGWYDFLRRDTVISYANWPNPKKMVIGPWVHAQSAGFDMLTEHLRFFDYWLKGIDNGIMKEPPIYYHTINAPEGKQWQFASEWPMRDQKQKVYFFNGGKSGTMGSTNDGVLNQTSPESADEKDDYKVVYGINAHVEPVGAKPSYKGASEWDQKGMTWTSEPLASDLKVTGHAIVSVWISSSSDDADVFVFLEDVDEAGNSAYVSDGRLRASLRAVHAPPYDFLDLPWHRAFKQDEHKLTPGKPVKLLIDLMPTATIFKKGHRIRVAITGSQGRTNYARPQTPPTISIHRNRLRASHIALPVTP